MITFNFQKLGENNFFSHIYKILDQKQQETGLVLKSSEHSQDNHILNCVLLNNEYEILQILKHDHVIRSFEIYQNMQITSTCQCAIVLEKANIDLFECLNQQQLPIDQIKSIFKDVIKGLQYIHSMGYAHNDIKLENLLLFESSDKSQIIPKIADFGFARPSNIFSTNPAQQYESWSNRRLDHAAPEIIKMLLSKKKNIFIDEQMSDVFALGVALFDALFRQSPYSSDQASPNDYMYRLIINKKLEKFWAYNVIVFRKLMYYEQQKDSNIYLLKDLLQQMLDNNPQTRINIENVLNHQWFQDKTMN